MYNGISRSSGNIGVLLVLDVVIGLLACVVFLVPVMGLRSRLVDEKKRLRNEIDQRLKSILGEANQSVDSRELSNMSDLNATINLLLKEREILSDISTWP